MLARELTIIYQSLLKRDEAMFSTLTIEDFLFIEDLEMAQYAVLNRLKNYKDRFLKNDLSGLSELSSLAAVLIRVEKKRSKILDLFPLPVKKVDAENRQLVFDGYVLYDEDVERMFELIKWAIPVLHETIDEALCVNMGFTKDNIDIYA